MTTIIILAMLSILVGVALSLSGFTVISSVDAQVTGENATMSGNMTGGNMTDMNMTGGNMTDMNMTGKISKSCLSSIVC
jgi:hypothetical protein